MTEQDAPEPSLLLPEAEEPTRGLRRVSFFVPGKPISQGSKKGYGRVVPGKFNGKGEPVVAVTMQESSKRLGGWRERIAFFAGQAWRSPPMDCAVRIDVTFYFARADSHYHKSKRRAGELREDAPRYPVGRTVHGDYEKLARALSDGIAGILVTDDKLVVTGNVRKRFGDREGASVVVQEETE